MKFHEIRFPESISFGAEGGPMRRAEIVQMANGSEHINCPWSQSVRRFTVSTGIKSLDELSKIIDFFEFCNGVEFGFRWKDWTDFKSSKPSQVIDNQDQFIGIGDGLTKMFKLKKTYGIGPNSYVREITKPVEKTVLVTVDEHQVQENLDFEINYSTGIVTFREAPNVGVTVKSGFEFDVPVRFDVNDLSIVLSHFDAGEIQNIEVKELMKWSQ